jgi:protein-tyrosine phosphatase
MIDLHSHILPGVDDGSPDLETSLTMARMAVMDGIKVMACTPHFMPGLYDNDAADIRRRVAALNQILVAKDINLSLVVGADAHIRPDFIDGLRNNKILRLHDSRYVLFEPSHSTMPPRIGDLLFNILMAGFVPILTHPERFSWIEQHYGMIERMVNDGVWMQATAGSLTGKFGQRAQYWAQRMLAEGRVHILATDAHNLRSRSPLLSDAFAVAAREVGLDEARNLVISRPRSVLLNHAVKDVVPLPAQPKSDALQPSRWKKLLMGAKS